MEEGKTILKWGYRLGVPDIILTAGWERSVGLAFPKKPVGPFVPEAHDG